MSTLNHLLAVTGPMTNELADEIKYHFIRHESQEVIALAQEFQRLAQKAPEGNFVPAPNYIRQAMACKDFEQARRLTNAIEALS
jgi:hypothetical protein